MKNNRKKITALCLCICYLISMSFSSAAEDANITAPAAEEEIVQTQENTKKAIPSAIALEAGFLDAMGMIPDGISFDKAVTREEAAVLITKMLNGDSLAENYTDVSYYNDVSIYSENLGYINAVTNEGLFRGRGDGTFAPDATITYAEFAKILVTAAGYSVKADRSGGFPAGYINVASQLKILRNSDSQGNGTVTWGDAVKMVYETMQVEILAITTFSTTGNVTIEKSEHDTILTLYHDIYLGKGQVTGTHISRMYGAGVSWDLEPGEVEINGNMLCYDEEKLASVAGLTGYRVDYFYRTKENSRYEYELVYAHLRKNPEITLYSYEILEVYGFDSGEGGTPCVKYRRDNVYKSDDISIDRNLALIVNNEPSPRVSNADIFPGTGKVTFIDSDNNNTYDVAIVLNYDTRVIDTVSIHGKYIYFQATAGEDKTAIKPLMLNSDFSNVTYEITQDGKPLSLRDLREDDIIGILESEHDDVIHYQIELISSAFEGAITEISEDEALVDGKTYKVAEEFNLADYSIPLGEKCKLYLNYANEIFYAEKTLIEYDFQYILLGAATQKSIGGNVQIKVVYAPHFNRHEVQILDLAEKVKVNGINLKGRSIVDALRLNSADSASLASEFMQPIRNLEFDDDGKVKKIDILPEGATSSRGVRKYLGDGPYNEAFGEYKVSYTTQFFYIPNSGLDEDWTFGELERLKFDSEYDTMMWGCDDEGLPEAVFIFHDQTTANPSYGINYERPMLVDEVKAVWNAQEQETVYRIKTYNSGGVFVYESDARNSGNQNFDDLKPGDVIFAALTSLENDSSIAKINVILGGNMWNYVRDIRLSDKSLSYYKASRTMYGVVDTIRTDIRLNKCVLNMYFGDDGYKSYDVSGVPIYYYDRAEKKVNLASYAAVRSREYFGEDGASNVYVWLDEDLDPAMIVIVGEK